MNLRTRLMLVIIGIGLVDTLIPIPLMCLLLIYVLLQKPAWFKKSVVEIYGA